MPSRFVVAGLAVLLACPAYAANFHPTFESGNTVPLGLCDQVACEPPSAELLLGDRAPTFSFLAPDGAWHQSKDVFQGPVLLVFGATPAELQALEQARSEFEGLGVKPVAVLDMRTGQAAKLSRELKLSCPVVCDPLRAIGDLYNSLDPRSLRHTPAYFVLDQDHVIRALNRGQIPDPADILDESARVLGKTLPEPAHASAS